MISPSEKHQVDREMARTLVESGMAGVLIGVLRLDGTIAWGSDGLWEKLGYHPEEVMNRRLSDFYWPGEETARVKFLLLRHFMGLADPIQFEAALSSKSGARVDVLVSARLTTFEGKRASLGVIVDITEAKQMRYRLEASQERFRLMVDHSPDAVLLYDADQQCLVEANPAAEKLFGRSRGEMIGLSPAEFYSPGQPDGRPATETFYEHYDRAKGGESLSFQRRVRRPTGEDRDCQVTIVRLPLETGFLLRVSFVDITEQLQRERALTKTNRALRTLSRVNNALIREESPVDLFQQICLAVIENGGYRMACVCEPEAGESDRLTVAACAGAQARDFHRFFELARTKGTPCICERAIETGEPQIRGKREGTESPAVALPLRNGGRIFGALLILGEESDAFDSDEMSLLMELANDLSFGITVLQNRMEIASFEQRLRAGFVMIIEAIGKTVEARDPYTAGHQQRVADVALEIARKMGMSEQAAEGLKLASFIHDIGKISIPASILCKPGQLSKEEFALIRTHAESGYEILKDIDFPWPIAEIVRQHHERIDGSGYPRGLKGDAILPEAQILAVADTIDAMTSHRPYRAASSIDEAVREIVAHRGTLFDPAVVDACVELLAQKNYAFDGGRPTAERASPN